MACTKPLCFAALITLFAGPIAHAYDPTTVHLARVPVPRVQAYDYVGGGLLALTGGAVFGAAGFGLGFGIGGARECTPNSEGACPFLGGAL